MPKRLAVIMLFVLICVAGAGNAFAVVVNGGFETGDLTGWTTIIPSGGYATVVTSTGIYTPVEGNYFLVMKTDGPGSYTQAYQTLSLSMGDVLTGWAAWEGNDNLPYNDNAYVNIYNSGWVLLKNSMVCGHCNIR